MRKTIGMLSLLAALCILASLYNPKFLAPVNVQNLTRQIALLAILGIGEGIVILSGGIDLSVGSVIALGGLIVAYGTRSGWDPFVVSAAVLAACAVVGLWHGFLVSRMNLQPFIVTLCSMLMFRGLARRLSEDQALGFGIQHPAFRGLGNGDIYGIPTPAIVLAVIAIACAILLHYTKYGLYLYAIGRSEKAVAYSGVNVSGMKTVSYVICGVLAGVSGILYAAYTNSVQPASTGQAYELYAIAAAVLGGCSLRGGEGTVIGIIIGASILKTLTNAINMVGISTLWELVVIGAVILLGVLGDMIYRTSHRDGKSADEPGH